MEKTNEIKRIKRESILAKLSNGLLGRTNKESNETESFDFSQYEDTTNSVEEETKERTPMPSKAASQKVYTSPDDDTQRKINEAVKNGMRTEKR